MGKLPIGELMVCGLRPFPVLASNQLGNSVIRCQADYFIELVSVQMAANAGLARMADGAALGSDTLLAVLKQELHRRM
jgi:hypothetical protein